MEAARSEGHIHFSELNISKFKLAEAAQRVLVKIQYHLLDCQYAAFGKTAGSWARYNIVFPSTFGSDRRKPVTENFQRYCDDMYCPIVYALLFGADVWKAELSMHLSSFKTNTIKVCESTAFHGMSSIQVVQLAGVFELLFAFPSVYVGSFDFRTEQLGDGACFRSLEHSSDNAAASANVPTEDDNGHVCNSVAHEGDHNATSQTSTRVGVCSTSRPSTEVTRAAPDSNNHNNTGSEDPSSCVTTIPISKGVRNGYGCTVYPIWQPIGGFHNNNEFHAYMKQRYPERALALGLPRPLYEIPEHLLYRAQPGEVLVHKSHAEPGLPQPIHAEANPCPDRYLYVLDFYNIINRSEDRLLPSSEVPEARILEQMGALSDATSARYAQRLLDVRVLGETLLDMADNMAERGSYPCQRTAMETVLACINEELARIS
eukprot:m.262492 g.262492  ORF g.262492 m.262492 type:complete len:431 (+) comp19697_c0_seq73:283-1575(+)